MCDQANRDIDALVAEKVMGYKWWKHTLWPTTDKVVRMLRLNTSPYYNTVLADGDEPLSPNWVANVPHYSTDIKDAFEIVVHFLKYAYGFELTWLEAGEEWECSIGDKYAIAQTAPLAICSAALLVVEYFT